MNQLRMACFEQESILHPTISEGAELRSVEVSPRDEIGGHMSYVIAFRERGGASDLPDGEIPVESGIPTCRLR